MELLDALPAYVESIWSDWTQVGQVNTQLDEGPRLAGSWRAASGSDLVRQAAQTCSALPIHGCRAKCEARWASEQAEGGR